ncbi:uncharacterized protein METZ01_LOCUS454653 [marine metagenome]|uniref:Uncharacterized protein n=1 Tax=marine metagenome TaxID=408172 RepID=A0A383A2J0_9ZZZZ
MGAKRGSGALLSIDFRPPWGGSAASIHHGRFPHFSPCDRSFCIAQRGKRTAEPLIALSMPSRPSRDWRSATLKTIVHHVQLVSWRPSTAFDDGAAKSPFPKTYKMVGDILDTHLLATLTRAVYANSPSQWVKSVITRYFFRTP